MYQKDFILKLIEMLGIFMAAIFSRIEKKEYKEAEELLEEGYFTLLKESAAKFTSIPKENLTDRLLSDYNFTNSHLEILAELFRAEAELRFAKTDYPVSLDFYEKSLVLFEFIDNNSVSFSLQRKSIIDEIGSKVDELKEKY